MGSLGGCMFWEKSNSCMTDFKPHVLQTLPEGITVYVWDGGLDNDQVICFRSLSLGVL